MMLENDPRVKKCVCGDDMIIKDGARKHTNFENGSRFTTKYCQPCTKRGEMCDNAMEASPKEDVAIDVKLPPEEKCFRCHYCTESFQNKGALMSHTKEANHKFPVEKLQELLKEELTEREIAIKMGFPKGTVNSWIRRIHESSPIEGENKRVLQVLRENPNDNQDEAAEEPSLNEKNLHQCRYCQESFQDKPSMMRHIRKVNHSFPIEKLEDLLGKGMRKRDICRELGFPPSTVSKYILQLSTTRLIQESGNETSSNYQEKDPDIEGYREEISQLKENLGKEIQEKSRLQSQIMDLSKELAVHENMVRTLSETLAATPKEEGVLRSRIEISEYEGYYDNQRKIITETIKEEIYHVAQGRRIILESRATSGNGRRIIVDISGEVK